LAAARRACDAGPVDALRYANLTLRFALELAALAALGYWGFAEHDGAAAILLGLGAPGLAALVWGLFVAPKAAVDLPPGGRLSCEVVVFAAAVCALWASDHTGPAVAMALAASVSRALLAALGDPAGIPAHRL
jgi:hypothetical protein